jgi:hypothetical protein
MDILVFHAFHLRIRCALHLAVAAEIHIHCQTVNRQQPLDIFLRGIGQFGRTEQRAMFHRSSVFRCIAAKLTRISHAGQ